MNFHITAPIGPFCRDNGVGRTKVYQLIGEGEIESVTIGRKRYIVVQSYVEFLKRQAVRVPALASPNPRAGSAGRSYRTDDGGPHRERRHRPDQPFDDGCITEQECPADKPKPARRRPGRPRRVV
jgi:hypothetical protein